MIQIRKAERKKAKIRVGLSSPSGAGKTYSSLLLAKGLVGDWSKIGLIDTENGRGDIYSDLGEYNIFTLQAPFSPERYIEVIRAMEEAGMQAIIIDSISHEWEGSGGCLEINEILANAKYRGNTWSAWNETTPRHRKFIEALIASPAHIITTVRNKVDTVMTDDKKVKKVGLKEITREGFEYELTVNFNLDRDTHSAIASKDNTRLFDSIDPFVITEKTGEKLRAWCESGVEDKSKIELAEKRITVNELLTKLGKDENWLQKSTGKLINQLTLTGLDSIIKQLDGFVAKKAEKDFLDGKATPEELKKMDEEDAKKSEAKKEVKPKKEVVKNNLSKTMTNSIIKNKKNE